MIRNNCVARYIEKDNTIVCGRRDIPWLGKNDFLAEYEIEGMKKCGYCEDCNSRLRALERKKCRQK